MPTADAAFARALGHWRAGSLQEAHAACLEALAHDGAHIAAAVLAAEILLDVGAATPATALLREVVRREPHDGALRLLLARARRLAGDLAAAERSAAAARRLAPGSAEAAAEHALALIALGRDEEALAAVDVAAGAAGDDAHAHWVVADTLLRLEGRAGDGALARAHDALERAVALDSAASTWHAAEARRHTSAHRDSEARALIARGLLLMPRDAELSHMAAAADGRPARRAPEAYVAAHFDAFADSFDGVLVGRLGYRLPDLICAALERHAGPQPLGVVLDAGCGTGLCAEGLRPRARRLVGVDLSKRMVQRADACGLYDELVVDDLLAWLSQDAQAGAFDAIVAADVLVYFGDLRPPLRAAALALRPGGLLVFSTERAEHAGGFALRPSGRFSHDPRHVAQAAAEAGFAQLEAAEVSYRVEGGKPVSSTLACVRLTACPV